MIRCASSVVVGCVALALLSAASSAAADPKGVRLRPTSYAKGLDGQPLTEPVLIPWGETLDQFKARWPKPPRCFPSLAHRTPITSCEEPESWYVDFGDPSFVPDLDLLFHESKFYAFRVSTSADRGYSLVYSVLLKSLGKPTRATSEPMQNAYGAKFESNEVAWESPNVTVTLDRRQLSIDDATMKVVYRPLQPAEKRADPTAPF